MHCIVCHSETMKCEILALATKCHKGVFAYNKTHSISTMMKHVEQEHVSLLKRFRLVLETFLNWTQ
jgi:hypothetical protein